MKTCITGFPQFPSPLLSTSYFIPIQPMGIVSGIGIGIGIGYWYSQFTEESCSG